MKERTLYRTCPDCGANNDPGEACDCHKAPSGTSLWVPPVGVLSPNAIREIMGLEPIKETENGEIK